VHTVQSPFVPHGRPLFSRAKKLFRAEAAWSWGGWDHREYGWLSDDECFFAEQYLSDPGYRIQRSHLYRYNVRTGKKTHLRRLEQLVDCFYHSQMAISPDGKWLMWNGGSDEKETIDVATLGGRHHRQWPAEYWTSTLTWTSDSRHWIEFKRTDAEEASFEAIVHDVYRTTANRIHAVEAGSFDRHSADYAVGDHIVFLDREETGETTAALNVTVSSLPPHIRREHTTRIAVPSNLPNPNIMNVCISPDAQRIAFIVGYGDIPTGIDRDEDGKEEKTSPASSVYHPSSVFTQEERNTKLRAYCIVVCNIDGTEMHEVGTWQEHVNPNVVLDLENLRWLPSGKRLSFVCDDVLYTVPAD